MRDEMTLTIPAKPEMMLVARMTLAGYCSQCGADVEILDDVRMLSDEACFFLMHQEMKAKKILISATRDGDLASIRFEAVYDKHIKELMPPHDPEIACGILGSLAVAIRLDTDGGCMNAVEVDVHLGPL